MTEQELINRVKSIKKGSFVRITYKTELPLKAAYKGDFNATKTVQQTVRLGCNYAKLKAVIAREQQRTEEKKEYKNPYVAEIPNVLYKHENGRYYLQFATVPNNANVRTTYNISGKEMTKQEVVNSGFVLDSYWKEKLVPEVQKIKIENIISL